MSYIINFDKKSKFITILHKKHDFLMYVYFAIILQIIFTSYSLYIYRNNNYLSNISNQSLIIYIIITTLLLFIISFFKFPIWFKFILFMIYAVVYAGMLHNINLFIPKDIINQFLIGMLITFILLTIFMHIFSYYNTDITFFGFILVGLVIGLMSSFVVKLHYNYIFFNINDIADLKNIEDLKNMNHIYILYIIIIFFSMYFIYSSNILLRVDSDNDYISGASQLYTGFINTIIYILL